MKHNPKKQALSPTENLQTPTRLQCSGHEEIAGMIAVCGASISNLFKGLSFFRLAIIRFVVSEAASNLM